ncbi:MAG: transglycosylase SLT domain-containing protein [Sulfurovum sp.]
MINKLIFVLLITISFSYATNFNPSKLSKDDINLLKTIKSKGQKYGFSYSLMAIAIKESSLGKYIINVNSKDFGLYQAHIKSVIARHKVKDTSWNRNRFAMKLISDFDFATKNAIDELQYWHGKHNGDWRKVWASYNGGWRYNSKRARKYSNDIAKIIRLLKQINV